MEESGLPTVVEVKMTDPKKSRNATGEIEMKKEQEESKNEKPLQIQILSQGLQITPTLSEDVVFTPSEVSNKPKLSQPIEHIIPPTKNPVSEPKTVN